MNFFSDERGNFGAITAVIAVPLVMAVGMAVDYSRLDSLESKAQHAIDAAALSGLNDDNTIDYLLAAKVFKQNADLQFGTQIGDPTFEKEENGNWEAKVTVRAKLMFGGFLLPSTLDLDVSTKVGLAVTGGGGSTPVPMLGCIHTLSDGGQSFTQNSGAWIDAPDCVINVGTVVQPNNGKTGFNDGFHLDVEKICVAGRLNYDNRSDKSSPFVETSCQTPGDFYKPAVVEAMATSDFTNVMNGSCVSSGWQSFDANQMPQWTSQQEANKDPGYEIVDVNDRILVMEPGKYCGGMNFNSGTYKIFLKPGLYIIQNDWNINGLEIYGEDVSLFYDNNGKWQPNSNTGLKISAPTSGPFKGFAIWEDPNKTSWKDWTIDSNRSDSYIRGVFYQPNRRVTLNSGAQSTYNASFMVKELMINGNTHMKFGEVESRHFPTSAVWSPPMKAGTASTGNSKKVVRLVN